MTYKDKAKHGVASFIIFTAFAVISKNLVFSFIATYSLGIIKEIYDQIRQKNTPIQSFQDIVSDMVGIVLGIFLYSMVIG